MEHYPIDERGFATDQEAERYYGWPAGRLRKERHFGRGPRCVRFGRSVRTSYAELDRHARENAQPQPIEAAA